MIPDFLKPEFRLRIALQPFGLLKRSLKGINRQIVVPEGTKSIHGLELGL